MIDLLLLAALTACVRKAVRHCIMAERVFATTYGWGDDIVWQPPIWRNGEWVLEGKQTDRRAACPKFAPTGKIC